MRHGTFPRLRQSLNLWHPVICQSSHILPETFMISILAMSIIKKMRAFLLAISFKYYRLKGGYRDSNPGPPEPQSGALTSCAIPTIMCYFYMNIFRYRKTSLKGFEPPTHGLEGRCSIQLSYKHTTLDSQCKRVMGIEPTYPAWKAGVLPLNYTRRSHRGDRIRTCDLLVPNQAL